MISGANKGKLEMALPVFDKHNKKSNQQWCLGFLILPAEISLVTDGQHISSRTVDRQVASASLQTVGSGSEGLGFCAWFISSWLS